VAWVKTDDRYDDTRKIKRAWRRNRATVGLHAMAKSYCARHETDGLLDLEWLEDRLPDDAEREQVVAVMTDVNLLEHLPAGERKRITVTRVKKGKPVKVTVTHGPLPEDVYILHDFLEFHESRQEAEERRQKDAERKTRERGGKGREQPADEDDLSTGSPPGHNEDGDRNPAVLHAVSPSPDPTRPDPTLTKSLESPPDPPTGGRKRDREKWERDVAAWVAENPASLLLDDWRPIYEGLAEQLGESGGVRLASMWRLDQIHPHALIDGTWWLGGPTQALEFLRNRAPRGLRFGIVECGCDPTREAVA
jgi:hypothetical protein